MAIHTKLGEKLINRSLRVDQHYLFFDGQIVKVEGHPTEKQYWMGDLTGDQKKEVLDVI